MSAVLMSQDSYMIPTQRKLNLDRMELDEEDESSGNAKVRKEIESEDKTSIDTEIIEEEYFGQWTWLMNASWW